MPRAVLMDFNGVILNDESFHLELYQWIVASYQIRLSKEEYYKKYLVLDDEDCLRRIFEDHKKEVSESELKRLVERKERRYLKEIGDRIAFFPGTADFIRKAAGRFRMAIVSGALRSEIEKILGQAQLLRYFMTVVSAEDVTHGKPDPEGLLLACSKLDTRPKECLVIEDAVEGVEMAHRAGMKCIAVTNTYTAEKLKKADLVIKSMEGFSLEEAEKLYR